MAQDMAQEARSRREQVPLRVLRGAVAASTSCTSARLALRVPVHIARLPRDDQVRCQLRPAKLAEPLDQFRGILGGVEVAYDAPTGTVC